MATVRFYLRGTKDVKSIGLSLSINRNNKFERKTGLFIDKTNWSKDKALPKQNNAENKKISSLLRRLASYTIDALNEAQSTGRTINADWLSNQIDIFFDRKSKSGKSELVLAAINNVLLDADVRKNQKGGIGLSNSRINDYKALRSIWEEFERNNPIKVKEVNIPLSKKFLTFMLKEKMYAKGYAQRMMGNLKTVCYDAGLSNIKTSAQLKKIDSSQIKNDHIIYLTIEELKKIKSTPLLHNGQLNARKWLLLGCWIGQRGNDLLGLSEENVREKDGYRYIELTQQKTNKTVQIPILPEVSDILQDGFPRKISLVKFNEHIKTIAKIAGVDYITKGILNDKETNRNKLGEYPKWKLLASHVCRRSFCSNMYGKMPTPIIMQVTGHSTEKSFLNYIGKKGTDYKEEWIKFIQSEKEKVEYQPQLSVVRNTISD